MRSPGAPSDSGMQRVPFCHLREQKCNLLAPAGNSENWADMLSWHGSTKQEHPKEGHHGPSAQELLEQSPGRRQGTPQTRKPSEKNVSQDPGRARLREQRQCNPEKADAHTWPLPTAGTVASQACQPRLFVVRIITMAIGKALERPAIPQALSVLMSTLEPSFQSKHKIDWLLWQHQRCRVLDAAPFAPLAPEGRSGQALQGFAPSIRQLADPHPAAASKSNERDTKLACLQNKQPKSAPGRQGLKGGGFWGPWVPGITGASGASGSLGSLSSLRFFRVPRFPGVPAHVCIRRLAKPQSALIPLNARRVQGP